MKETRKIEFLFEIGRILVALAIAYALTLLCIMAISDEPGKAVYMFAVGPFTTMRRFGQMIGKFIPYLLTGSGMCFVYASNRFNLSGEGIYLFSGCLVAWTVVSIGGAGIPHIALIILLICIGAASGAALGFIPAVLREKVGANEVVVSIMMNYALLYSATYILKTKMRDDSVTYMASPIFGDNAKLSALVPNSNIHTWVIYRSSCCRRHSNHLLQNTSWVCNTHLRVKSRFCACVRHQHDPQPYNCAGSWRGSGGHWRLHRYARHIRQVHVDRAYQHGL